MNTRDAYKKQMEAHLNELSAQINLLVAKAESAGADAKLKYAQDLDMLQEKKSQVAEKIKELEAASGDAWEKIKDTADNLWEELKTGIAHTAAKFK